MRYRTLAVCLVMAYMLTSLVAYADPAVTIGGKPFTGVVVRNGDKVFVEVESLIKALGLYHQRVVGGWYVYKDKPDASKQSLITMSSQVVVGDRLVDTQVTDDRHLLVDLNQAMDALGLKVDVADNAISVPLPSTWRQPAAADTAPRVAPGPLPPLRLGGDHPGQVIDINGLLIRGRFNVVYYYTQGNAKCKEIAPRVPKFLEAMKDEPRVRIILVDLGYENSPLAKAYGIVSLPTMVVTNRNLVRIAVNPGHSTISLLSDPNFMKVMQEREDNGSYVP